jgi:divalent metal cation (Fe/Co/Zn/Cd) transporter
VESSGSKSFNYEYITIIYNLIEAYVSIVFGIMANSIGLIGFGVQSIAESVYGIALIVKYNSTKTMAKEAAARQAWRFRRFAVFAFFGFGTYLLFDGGRKLIMSEIPKPSLAGIIIALVSLIATPLLIIIKYKTGPNKGGSLAKDLRGTFFYMLLPLLLLAGLLLNFYTGYWQADPVVAIIIAVFLFKKGFQVNSAVDYY